MNMNPYIQKQLEVNPCKIGEENPYLYHKKQENQSQYNPYQQPKKEENPYLKKKEKNNNDDRINQKIKNQSFDVKILKDHSYLQKKEENPYLKKKDQVLIDHINVNSNRKSKNSTFNVEISDPIITDPKNPSVVEVDRFRLRNIPIHKENPYVNWKFSNIKDIDQTYEQKCIKATTQNIRIDAFTVTQKPVNNEYLIELDWKINEEFIDAVRIEQEGTNVESNVDSSNVDVEDKLSTNNLFRRKRRNSTQEKDPWTTFFETTQFEDSSKNKSDKEDSGWTFFAVVDDDLPKESSLNSYDESKELKEAIEIAAKATVLEPDKQINSDQNIIIDNTQNFNDSDPLHKSDTEEFEQDKQINSDQNIIVDNTQNSNDSDSLHKSDTEEFEPDKQINSDQNIIVDNTQNSNDSDSLHKSDTEEETPSNIGQAISKKDNDIVQIVTKDTKEKMNNIEIKRQTNNIAKKNSSDFIKKIELLQEQLRLMFESQILEKKLKLSKDEMNASKNIQEEKMNREELSNDDPIADNKETVERNLGITFSKTFRVDEKKSEQQQKKAEEKYSAQLNVKFNGEIGYDHNITSKLSKLPDDAPTFILVGNRFVREDKALIDLDVSDLDPVNSNNNKKKQLKLPPELQDIDYEGWYKQQIAEEYQNNFKNNNKNQSKKVTKPSETFLEEFDLI